ncbi:methyl-accepting chemotaxis protein, putative [Bodo saltans]|uniref:Methyl-accepting chemotaxis protein, putative n=1 Tax=Bodo saltans TaxID=75058 RepID=A0A0S4IWV5_BODSA|nr:methyl-accepting chemotaxis protein, putative [Bodo saltans]|eukprot:CUG33156.1 methyl-accepting chemotaxis protein, putative [Bodo saltans]
MGTVQQFNPASEKQLGYRADQVIHQNVKMLMPDVVAEQHDQFLLRYRETGIKNILDNKRRAHAKKADGRSIAVEIFVKEVVVEDLLSDTGVKRLFVGYLRDITEEFQMMKANILNDAITNLCTIPMISITRIGSILTFSLAAEKQFGYKFEEVQGKNIKMLMPQRIATNHDGYLRKYLETGEKHVIDTTRLAVALTASGEEFPAEIAVKEIRKSGLDTIYVGYVRNVKTEIEVDDTRLMVDTIVNVSPIPIIVINMKGTVLKFSSEANRVFGWKAEEIIGKNIKMLMPQEIARNHDNHLKNYIKTGVKTIIDGIRTLQAVRKDGLHLSMEIMVRELNKDNSDRENSLFVGYLRDMSQEYILRQSNELKDVILNESSIPMIQIDTKGRIMFVNPALLAEFQYEEHLDHLENVKILTPPEIARNHDGFLSTYLKTGVKHVLDSIREVTGYRKDGSRFPINISVRELDSDGQPTYFGYIRNMTQSMQIRDQKALGDVIIDLSMIPLIIMDEIGTVMAFNRAASEAFRYDQEEVVGKNIKMLQTADVAAIHDQYLANYKKHRVKSVIDTTRRVMGRKKNGYAFPLEITVKELRDNDSMTSTYVGYLRNITDEYRLNLANEIADAVSAMSPTPLIAMTTRGIVTKFSRAAEEEFGYTAEEVIGQNIKMLQPESVAVVHDEYLDRYLKTGVKRVVDQTRIVTAKKRDGTEFPASITVREIIMEGVERTFVGFLRNLTNEIQDESSGRVNFKIMGMMMTPLVVIDEIGTIEEANQSLLETFGYESEELLGSNVSSLMPEEIAEKHDGYLSRYLQTGIQVVLKEKRIVTAKHHDGSRFPIEVNVKELFSKELNRRTYFGFLRDLRQDLELKVAFMLNDAVTDMITIPIIAIDQVGTILKFSKAAGQVFGYDPSEVLGRNINSLMPEPFAGEHDGYLSRYQVTRIKNVVDSIRRIPAKKKDGTLFKASLRVREFSKEGGSSTFVGFLKDMTEMDAQEQENKISTVVSAMSQLAVIIADKRGFIQSVNDAAALLFNYRTEELIGQNLKLLMPRQYAMHHDNYLEAYHRTKVKHVVDTTRRVQGVKKGDVVFEIEIGVRELELDGIGTRYLGFVRDITDEVALDEASKVSNAIISLSPVPIIVIDVVGTIMKYSELAGALFGYSYDEVVGRNIKLLMPDEIAIEHDMYLSRYVETGVKRVIDSIRVAKAKRKDGTLLEVEISVKNVKSTDGQLYFVGYVKPLGDIFSVYEAIKAGKAF